MESFPLISVGVPVFNAEKTIERTLNSLISQDYVNLEILISDNNSTDRTLEICHSFLQQSDRIRIVRQLKNLGPISNFEYVLKNARGEYFMWCAGDDYLSTNSVSDNYKILISNPSAVGSSSINSFENSPDRKYKHEISGDLETRIKLFFRYRRELHGNFYCLFKRELLFNCSSLSKSFIGWDWAIIFFLILRGDLLRSGTSEAFFGAMGVSRGNRRDLHKILQLSWHQSFFPYFVFSYFTMQATEYIQSWRLRLLIFGELITLNASVVKGRLLEKLVVLKNHN